jgi:hypothetical protein
LSLTSPFKKTSIGNAVLNQKDLIAFTQMREIAELTNEELAELQKLTYISGINLEDNVGSLLAAAKITGLNNKILLNEKDIMRDVSKTSKAIQLSLGGNGKALGIAAAQAKILGMNLKQVENIAGSLLDFESSISAELEAELLTGKDLNLERARLYAINNDMAGVAREISKNFGSAAEFSKMNRIQQEAAAKAVGMTREDLAATLTDKEALAGLNGEDLNAAKAALEFARAQGMTEAEIGKRSIADLKKQMNLQERYNATVEKLQEIFISIAQPLLPILDILASVFDVVGQIVKFIDPVLRVISSFAGLVGDIIDPESWKNNTSRRYDEGTARFNKSVKDNWKFDPTQIGDMFSPANGETQVSTKEGGIFTLSKNDDIVAAPGLGDMVRNNSKNNTTATNTKDDSKIIAAIEKLAINIANRSINVSAKVNNRELLNITAATAGERSNIEKEYAYNLQ